MKYSFSLGLLIIVFISADSYAKVNEPDGYFAFYEDATFHLKGDYLGYFKYFNERDLNGINGNYYYIHPVTDEKVYTQTEEIERFWQHEVRLYPKIVFNDRLEFKMRLDVGPYLFQSDLSDRIYLAEGSSDPYTMSVVEDQEKIKVKEANLMMVTPVGLFLVGRFNETKHGLIYGVQLPQFPEWTFGIPWLIKHEGKRYVESGYVDYTQTRGFDYRDNDDQIETGFYTRYDSGNGFNSQQWVDIRFSDSGNILAKNTRIFLPQWKMEWETSSFECLVYLGVGTGTIAELTKMDLRNDLIKLIENSRDLSAMLQANNLSAPQIYPQDIVVDNAINMGVVCWFKLGNLTPEVGFCTLDGAKKWYEAAGFCWDEYEPAGYRMPRLFKLLLFGEIEDKYFPLFSTPGTARAFGPDDICYTNVTGVKFGSTYAINEKWELFGQATGLWRTKTEYFEKDYWEVFPVMYALENRIAGINGDGHADELVPLLLMYNDVDYTPEIDPFMGIEFNGSVTYTLFDGLKIRFLGSYYKIGGFYKDVMTPKPYRVEWVWMDSVEPGVAPDINADHPMHVVYGPYRGATAYDPVDAWSVQLQVDFKFEL